MLRWVSRVWVRVACALALLSLAAAVPLPHARAQGSDQLQFGASVTGALDASTFRHVYTFTAQANDVIALHMNRTSGNLDPYLLLTDESGGILALSDDEGINTNAAIEFKRIPAEGRYFVIATRFGQERGTTTGQFSLRLERVGATGAQNAVLAFGDSAIGRLTDQNPLVFYFVRAKRGDVINVVLQRTSGDLDPLLDFATSDGVVLTTNDDDPNAGGTLAAALRGYTIMDDGIYLIVVTRFGREAGDTDGSYVLTVTQTAPDGLGTRPDNARLLDYGGTLEGALDDDVPYRYFRFDARRGDVITATLENTGGNLDPLLKLLDANLAELAQDDNSLGGGDARIAAFTIPRGGRYYLVATRKLEQNGQTTGLFAIGLNGRSGIVGGRALEMVYDYTVSGQISDSTVSEEYVFVGNEGDVIRITMERASGDLDSLVTLYDDERKQIAFDDDSGGEKDALIAQQRLPRDGVYIIVASRFDRERGTTSGAYLLTLDLLRAGN